MIILIGNKADLEAQRDVTYEEAKQFAEENGESRKEQRGSESRKEGPVWRKLFNFAVHHAVRLFVSLQFHKNSAKHSTADYFNFNKRIRGNLSR